MGKLSSRCLTILCQEMSVKLPSLEIFNVLHTKKVFLDAIHGAKASPKPWATMELDMVEMSPNISRADVIPALNHIIRELEKVRQSRPKVQSFAVSKVC